MKAIFFELSKYIFVFIIMYYAYAAYRGSIIRNESKRKNIYVLQYILIFLMHFFGYLILLMKTMDNIYAFLYMGQLILITAIIGIYMFLYPKASKLLVNNMCMLLVIGFIMLGRLSSSKCMRQLIIAAAAALVSLMVPWILKCFKSIRKWYWLYCFLGLGLLFSLFLGSRIFGANLVLTVGPVSVQPAEFVKIIFVLFVASMFNKSTEFRQVVITTCAAALHVMILVVSKDLGAALILFVIYLMMLYSSSKKITYLLAGVLAGSGAAVVAYKLFYHVRTRVTVWLDPWPLIDDKGYQITQSLFSIGMGSWFGTGIFNGLPNKIPVAEKDFMFSAICEEFGVVFGICLILLCLNCLILIMNIASMCRTDFYRLVAIGLGSSYGFQVFLTIGGAIKMIPLTGVTLPFVSYGGSSVLSSFMLFAIINGMYIMRHDEGESDEKGIKKRKAGQKEQKKTAN